MTFDIFITIYLNVPPSFGCLYIYPVLKGLRNFSRVFLFSEYFTIFVKN